MRRSGTHGKEESNNSFSREPQGMTRELTQVGSCGSRRLNKALRWSKRSSAAVWSDRGLGQKRRSRQALLDSSGRQCGSVDELLVSRDVWKLAACALAVVHSHDYHQDPGQPRRVQHVIIDGKYSLLFVVGGTSPVDVIMPRVIRESRGITPLSTGPSVARMKKGTCRAPRSSP